MSDNKKYLTPLEYDKAIKNVLKKIKDSEFQPDIILGVMRGGLMPAIYASHLLGKVPVYSIRASEIEWEEFYIQEIVKEKLATVKKVLITDEFIDSGAVILLLRRYFEENHPNLDVKFSVVYAKKNALNIVDYYSEVVDDGWLVFPYEKD